jgi:hypothetical protein
MLLGSDDDAAGLLQIDPGLQIWRCVQCRQNGFMANGKFAGFGGGLEAFFVLVIIYNELTFKCVNRV